MAVALGFIALSFMYNPSEMYSWGKITAISSFIIALMRRFNLIDTIFQQRLKSNGAGVI